MPGMRTNIVLDDDLVQEAMRHSDARTKRALVDEALRTFIRVKTEEELRQSYRDGIRDLESRLQEVRLSQPPHEVLRADRDRE
jgi:Arc/MetJ family transcription regulator